MKALNRLIVLSVLLLVSGSTQAAEKRAVLTINDYVHQVTTQNGSYRADEYSVKSYDLRTAEASLDFMPAFIADVSYSDNRLVPVNILYPGQTITWGGYFGIQTKLRTGTQVKLIYNSTFTNMAGSGVFQPQSYYYNYPQLTVSQPLWRDFWAAASKADEDARLASFKVMALQKRFAQQQISFNAETAYWRMALYKQIVEFDKQALDRADKILKRNRKRVSMNVADRGDSLQSQASFKQRELQLQTDLEALRQVGSQFNSLRNISGDQVHEDLMPLDKALEDKLTAQLQRAGERLDTQAAVFTAEAEKFQSDANRERVKPDVSIYGTAQLSGRNPTDFGQAQADSLGTNNPLYAIGMRVSIPLDISLVNEINQGNRAATQASQLAASRARFELDQDWNDLQKRFVDTAIRFKMARELEELQKEKLDHEKSRLGAGRTTLFQVLQFEDNFFDAQLARLRIENDAITLRAQSRLYNGENL